MWAKFELTGGVVTRRNASALLPGELVSASGLRLKPGDLVQVHADKATQQFAAVSRTVVAGPFWMPFENSTDKLMVVTTDGSSSYIETADAGTSGTFTSIQTITGVVTAADVVHRGDQYFVGTDKGNYVVQDNVARAMGMDAPAIPNKSTANVIKIASSTGSEGLVHGDVLFYWATEYDSVNDIESGPIWFDRDSVETSGTEVEQHRLTEYTPINSGTTHFRYYRRYTGNALIGGSYSNGAAAHQAALAMLNGKAPLIGGLIAEVAVGSGDYDYEVDDKYDPAVSYPLVSTDNVGTSIFEYLVKTRNFTVGALFNDALVVNDPATSKQILRYSPSGYPEYQPDPYFLYFATKRSDEIVGLRVVNDRLVVLLKDSVFRVNYLPTGGGDLAAVQGRVQEPITERSGALGRWAHTTVETESGSLVVWASKRGLEWTDGLGAQDACPDFAGITNANAVLVNNEKLYRLELYDGTQRWDFYYHPTLVKNGRMRLMGPTTVSATVDKGADSNADYVWLGSAAEVLVGNQAPSSVTGTLLTGHIKTENPFGDIACQDVGLTHTALDSAKARVYGKLQGEDRADTGLVSFPDVSGDETGKVSLSQRGKYLEVELQATGTGDWSAGPMYLNLEVEHGGDS